MCSSSTKLLAAGLAIMAASTGCAVHYRNAQSGSEHLWGVGELRLKTEKLGTGDLGAITAGSRMAGLCFELGSDGFGVSFGYIDRQRTLIVDSNDLVDVQPPTRQPALQISGSDDISGGWAVGHVTMKTLPSTRRRHAVVTGKAVAGIAARIGGEETRLGASLDSKQSIVVHDDILLEIEQPYSKPWPHFDFFSSNLTATTAEAIEADNNKGTP